MIDVISLNDKYYVNIIDFIDHLNLCAESVTGFCGETEMSKAVTDTLHVTIETLEGFMNDEVRVV